MYTYVLQRPTRHLFTYFEHMSDMAGKIKNMPDMFFTDSKRHVKSCLVISSHVKSCQEM